MEINYLVFIQLYEDLMIWRHNHSNDFVEDYSSNAIDILALLSRQLQLRNIEMREGGLPFEYHAMKYICQTSINLHVINRIP